MVPTSTRILVCTAIDMRPSFDGLAKCTRELLQHAPESGALFLFTGNAAQASRRFGGTSPVTASCTSSQGWAVQGLACDRIHDYVAGA